MNYGRKRLMLPRLRVVASTLKGMRPRVVRALLGVAPILLVASFFAYAGLSSLAEKHLGSGYSDQEAQPGGSHSSPSIKFREISSKAGLMTMPNSSSERHYIVETMGGGGVGLFDCDNDGRLDIVVVNDSTIDQYLHGGDLMVTLYRQDGRSGELHFTDVTKNSGLTARGWGTKSNGSAIGARVSVQTSNMTQTDEVRGGGGYNSSNDLRLHFGLGSESRIRKVEILWPSGAKQEFHNVQADESYEIEETHGIRAVGARIDLR